MTLSIVSAWVFSPAVLAAPGDAPEWLVGQTWTYRGYITAPGPPDNFTTTLTVVAMDAASALLRTEDAWDQFGLIVTETLFSLPDFAVIAVNTTYSNGHRSDLVYDRPLHLFDFPLTAGASWTSPTVLGTYAYEVLPSVEVTAPAGAFDVFPVEQRNSRGVPFFPGWTLAVDTGRALLYYSGDVGQVVKYVPYDSDGEKLGEVAITSPAGRPIGSPPYLAVGLVGAALVAAAAVLMLLRRRRARPDPVVEKPRTG